MAKFHLMLATVGIALLIGLFFLVIVVM